MCASGRGHPHGVPRAPTDRPSGYSSPMDPRHHPGSSGARSGAALRCLTVRVGAPLNSAGQRLPPLLTSGRLVAHTLCDGKSAHGRARAQRQQEKSSRVKRERTRAEDGARASRTCGAQSHARAAHRATHVRARVKLVRRTDSYVRRTDGGTCGAPTTHVRAPTPPVRRTWRPTRTHLHPWPLGWTRPLGQPTLPRKGRLTKWPGPTKWPRVQVRARGAPGAPHRGRWCAHVGRWCAARSPVSASHVGVSAPHQLHTCAHVRGSVRRTCVALCAARPARTCAVLRSCALALHSRALLLLPLRTRPPVCRFTITQGVCDQPAGRQERREALASRIQRSPDPHGKASECGARARSR